MAVLIPRAAEFCKLRNLEELDLSLNYGLDGVLPPCFANLTSLRLLDLSTNNFKGESSNLRSLEYIRLGDNHFESKFSFSLLASHSKVKLVEILNNDDLEVETEDSNWVPMFQLEVLVLSRCNLNKQSPKVPTFLAYQSMLKVLDLSHNNLRGGFPDWVIKNNSQLQVLRLSNNSLEGQLHFQPILNTSILWMDVSENQQRGILEENLGRKLPYMTTLNSSRNHFEGFVSSSFCNMSGLVQLDLSNNFFDGKIAKEMVWKYWFYPTTDFMGSKVVTFGNFLVKQTYGSSQEEYNGQLSTSRPQYDDKAYDEYDDPPPRQISRTQYDDREYGDYHYSRRAPPLPQSYDSKSYQSIHYDEDDDYPQQRGFSNSQSYDSYPSQSYSPQSYTQNTPLPKKKSIIEHMYDHWLKPKPRDPNDRFKTIEEHMLEDMNRQVQAP
ncbi:receptor-like protein 14 [Ipomoea triloba]|uniref:receptor-like protein 14 n=1 Tax=Ipomoea triloba TaxID=35885 RepID=UPI00125E38E7|nr:receptor-like protein 14 [Ipomoea triloba]